MGELSASGLEIPSHTVIMVGLSKGKKSPAPGIESSTEIMTIVSG